MIHASEGKVEIIRRSQAMNPVVSNLQQTGVPYRERRHAAAFSAQRRARYLRESGRRVAKSILISADGALQLVLIPACRRLDLEKLRAVLGSKLVRLATRDELERAFPRCEHGIIPGFGKPFRIPTVVDRSLSGQPYLVVPGVTWFSDYQIEPKAYDDLEQPLYGDVSSNETDAVGVDRRPLRTEE
jgi:Ala-tRNA(Pro) deacylase